MNNKGFSLVETIIAVALISVVMVFLYELLADVNERITNNAIALANQEERLEIIKYIQNDLDGTTIDGINYSNDLITIQYDTRESTTILMGTEKVSLDEEGLFYNEYYIKVTNKAGNVSKWYMDEAILGNLSTSDFTSNAQICLNKSVSNNFNSLYINIPVYTTNTSNTYCTASSSKNCSNKQIDDITIEFVGDITASYNNQTCTVS